jgi:parallel beta-helix repeat protein
MLKKILIILILLLLVVVNTALSSANFNNHYIVDDEGDGDFTNIQDAINNATDGDFIWVYSGNYSGDININKTLSIIGVDQEYLNGSDTGNPRIWASRVYIHQTTGVLFTNFSLEGNPDACKIKIEDSNNCSIINCSADYLLLYNANKMIVDHCVFTPTFDYFASVNLILSSNNIITNNICIAGAPNTIYNTGICLQASNNNQLLNNTCIARDSINTMATDPAIYISLSHNNIIKGNNITQSDIGVKLRGSNKNEITRNNFINNSNHAFFKKCKGNTWSENYWDDLTTISRFKIIMGKIGPIFGLIPWINIDFHPTKEPY